MIQTTGSWNPEDRGIFFRAGTAPWPRTLLPGIPRLIAINEVPLQDGRASWVEESLADGFVVVLDSGVFNLAAGHAERHNMALPDAFQLPPDEVDGFDALYDKYLTVARTYGDKVWGIIELDQGGEEGKEATRSRLHAEEVYPIPVYHPLGDRREYLTELLETHDRVAVGNLVALGRSARMKVMSYVWEVHRAFPDRWIHFLGVSPADYHHAIPFDSCDSSTWTFPLRWGSGFMDGYMGGERIPTPPGLSTPIGGGRENRRLAAGAGYLATNATAVACTHWSRELEETLGLDRFASHITGDHP